MERLEREGANVGEIKGERRLMAPVEGQAQQSLTPPRQKGMTEKLRRLRALQAREDVSEDVQRKAFDTERKLLDEMNCGL